MESPLPSPSALSRTYHNLTALQNGSEIVVADRCESHGWRLLALLLGVVALAGAAEVTGCDGEDCGGASCPLPVVVALPPDAVPANSSPRLCVDDTWTDHVTETGRRTMVSMSAWSS